MHSISRDNLPSFSSFRLRFVQLKDKITVMVRPYIQNLENITKEETLRSFYENSQKVKKVILNEKTLKIAAFLFSTAAFFGILYLVKKVNALKTENKQLSADVKNEKENATAKVAKIREKVNALKTENKQLSADVKNEKENTTAKVAEIREKFNKSLEEKDNLILDIRNNLEGSQKTLREAQQDKTILQTKISEFKVTPEEIEESAHKITKLETDCKNLESQLAQMEIAKNEQFKESITAKDTEITDIRNQLERSLRTLSEAQQENKNLQTKISDYKITQEEVKKSAHKITKLETDCKNLESQLAQMEIAKNEQFKESITAKDTEITDIRNQLERSLKTLSEAQQENTNLQTKYNVTFKELQESADKIKNLEAECKNLQLQLAQKQKSPKKDPLSKAPEVPLKRRVMPRNNLPTKPSFLPLDLKLSSQGVEISAKSKNAVNNDQQDDLSASSFELIEDDLLACSMLEALKSNPKMIGQLPQEQQGIFAGFVGGIQDFASAAKTTATVKFLSTARYLGSTYAYETFTKNAPEYKVQQTTLALVNLQIELAKAIGFKFEEGKEYFYGLNSRALANELTKFVQPMIHLGYDDEQIKNLKKLFYKLRDLGPIKVGKDMSHDLSIKRAPEIRYNFLMELEKVMAKINYEKDIKVYLKLSPEDRKAKYPHIFVLHLISKHLTETPIWNQATTRLGGKDLFEYEKIDCTANLDDLLRSDVAKMKGYETKTVEDGGWERWGVKCEKARMMTPGTTAEATNYRSNYSSLLGTLSIDGLKLNWLAMGTPSMDGGADELNSDPQTKPARLTAQHTLYLDYLKSDGITLTYANLQKMPINDFDPKDYEGNRTAAFIEASKNPRWKDTFFFYNLSFDQIMESKELDLMKVEKLTKNLDINLDINTFVSIESFSQLLTALMVEGKNGFYGLKEKEVKDCLQLVKNTFFPDQELLNYKKKWVFVMLSYAMIVLELARQNKSSFHTNCKDGMDRAGALMFAIKFITCFRQLADEKIDLKKRINLTNELRTIFSHRADAIKGQAVIEERAPLAYFVAEHVESLIKNGVSAEQLKDLPNYEFTPFEAKFIEDKTKYK